MYTKLITPFFTKVGHPVMVEEVKHSTQKEARIIDTLEPVLTMHKLIVDQKVIENDFRTSEGNPKYGLFYQLTRVTRDRGSLAHDDRLDALAMAVAYWTEFMSADNTKASEAIKAKALDDALRGFIGGVLGSKPRDQSWLSTNSSRR